MGKDGFTGLGAGAKQDVHRGVAAVIEDHVGGTAVSPVEGAVDIFPILGQRLALLCEHRNTGGRNRRSSLVLGRKDVAG